MSGHIKYTIVQFVTIIQFVTVATVQNSGKLQSIDEENFGKSVLHLITTRN